MTIAEDGQGRPHACCLVVYDQQCTVSLMGGADPALRSSGAKPLLEWGSIQFAASVSEKFDFEGSSMPEFEPYIRRFGGLQRGYFSIWRIATNESNSRTGKGVKGLVRRLKRRVLRAIA